MLALSAPHMHAKHVWIKMLRAALSHIPHTHWFWHFRLKAKWTSEEKNLVRVLPFTESVQILFSWRTSEDPRIVPSFYLYIRMFFWLIYLMCILILHSWPCSFKPRLFTLSLCCISHRPSSDVSDSGSLLMMWWPLNVQWRGLLFLYLFCSRGETDSLGQDVLSATQQAGWESRQSVRGHIRSRKQACLPQLSLHEWWLLWNVSLFLLPFLPVRISERCGSPLSGPPLSFSVRRCRYADIDGHVQRGWLLCLEILTAHLDESRQCSRKWK